MNKIFRQLKTGYKQKYVSSAVISWSYMYSKLNPLTDVIIINLDRGLLIFENSGLLV